GVPSIAMAFISDEFHKKSLGKVMGLYIAGNSIGGMFGRLATGVFTDLWNWHVALTIIGLISIFLSFYFKFALPTAEVQKPATKKTETGLHRFTGHLKNPALVSLFLVAFLIMGGFVTLFNYIGYRLSDPPYNLSQTIIGAIFIVYITGTLSSAWMGALADKKGQGPVALLSLAIMIIGGLGTLASNLIVVILFIAVFTFGFFGIHSVASRWVGDWAGTNKTQASSLYLLLYYGGSSIVGVTGGYFWSRYNWIGVILLVTLLLVLAFFLVLYVSQRQARLQNLRATTSLK
ncbi:MAG TPA: MFS transporter, partial [Sporolactobacillaceae bacterium]|nr:MFS transporter [Sporolactobacillaceae bacterium]